MALILKWTAEEVNENIIKRSILMGKSRERSAPVGSSGPTPVRSSGPTGQAGQAEGKGHGTWLIGQRAKGMGSGP